MNSDKKIVNKKYLHSELTGKIIKCFYRVYNKLGYGFLEKVYENALFCELNKCGLTVGRQVEIDVWYENALVGKYFADLVVNNSVIIELKASESLKLEHEYQLLNYLKATVYEVGLLLNFGKKPEQRRKVYLNTDKNRTQDGILMT